MPRVYIPIMPKRSSKRSPPDDPNEAARRLLDEVIEGSEKSNEEEKPSKKNPAAVALGRLGGMKGGPARAKKLSPKRRSEIAAKAARKRWDVYMSGKK